MTTDKKTFLNHVTILHDTREQENIHIISELDRLSVAHQSRKLDYGDYSFAIDGRDFSLSCVVERKANADELYHNIMKDRQRIENELEAGCKLSNQFTLLLENCGSMEELKGIQVSDRDMIQYNRKVKDIGFHCYNAIRSWESGNRYRFRTLFVKNSQSTAAAMLEEFYYYWRNYRLMTAGRRWNRG